MKKYIEGFFISLFGALLLTACGTNQLVQQDTPDRSTFGQDTIEVTQFRTLADLLYRLPGVMVDERGGNVDVFVRGRRPLFVVDGMPVGHSYWSADSAVNVFDIASIEVLRTPAETVMYGRRGGNGVIAIRTK